MYSNRLDLWMILPTVIYFEECFTHKENCIKQKRMSKSKNKYTNFGGTDFCKDQKDARQNSITKNVPLL